MVCALTFVHPFLGDGKPDFTGYTAYRALLRQSKHQNFFKRNVTQRWLGNRTHYVIYPCAMARSLMLLLCLRKTTRARSLFTKMGANYKSASAH